MIRVGLLGYGEIAQYHDRHLTAAGALVVGAVSRRPLREGLRRFGSLPAMLPHVDAVTVAVPNHLHASLAADAIRHGRAVFVEKPIALTEAGILEIERAIARRPVAIAVGFRLRWNPALRALRERLDHVRRVECEYTLGIDRLAAGKGWTRRAAESGGGFFTLGVHAYDLARWLARAGSAPLEDLAATSGASSPASADFPLCCRLEGRLPHGVQVVAGADLRGEAPFTLTVRIDGRTVELARLPRPAPGDAAAADVEYRAMMADFVQAAESGGVDAAGVEGVLNLHRDLVRAAAMAGSGPG